MRFYTVLFAAMAGLTVGLATAPQVYSKDPAASGDGASGDGASQETVTEKTVFSGPQPGEKLVGLNLVGVYDDQAGKEFDPVADASGGPTLLVFVHKITRPGLGLVRGVTSYADTLKDSDVNSAVAWLSADKADAEAFLNRARKSLNLKVPVGISPDGEEGPGSYGLNRNVELTVLVAKENKVVANFALIQPSMTDGVKIAGELAKVIGKKPPSSDELIKIAYPGQAMNRMRMRQRQRGSQPPNQRQRSRQRPDSTDNQTERTEKE